MRERAIRLALDGVEQHVHGGHRSSRLLLARVDVMLLFALVRSYALRLKERKRTAGRGPQVEELGLDVGQR
jgi:hypothetical protein